MASALGRLPPHAGTVYSGANLDPETLAKYTPGATVYERSFLSTSMSRAVATGFAKNVLFVIDAKERGADVSAFGMYPEEQEVLFPPGTPFEVISRNKDGHGMIVIELREVPSQSVPS